MDKEEMPIIMLSTEQLEALALEFLPSMLDFFGSNAKVSATPKRKMVSSTIKSVQNISKSDIKHQKAVIKTEKQV